MTAALLALPLSGVLDPPAKKRRVLLVDMSPARSDLRAEVMRKRGMDVDCAADMIEARSWWRADLYNLVLIDGDTELGRRDKFCEDMRSATPPQRLAFLVGKPGYLADEPNQIAAASLQGDNEVPSSEDLGTSLLADGLGILPQRWGILEACKQISAVRCMSDARSKAIRQRPAPIRDCEPQRSKRPSVELGALSELQRGELQ
jgi:hypothetical protein